MKRYMCRVEMLNVDIKDAKRVCRKHNIKIKTIFIEREPLFIEGHPIIVNDGCWIFDSDVELEKLVKVFIDDDKSELHYIWESLQYQEDYKYPDRYYDDRKTRGFCKKCGIFFSNDSEEWDICNSC
jgi:hypothetical protein